MFAAASGARLAHRHNKTAQKQLAAGQIEGYQIRSKGLPRHHQLHHQQPIKYSDVAAFRYPGIPQRRLASSTKLYSSQYNPGLKLSTSFVDINGRIANLGQFDFEGKAAWQDREFYHELERRQSICIPSEVHSSSKLKQKEAHRRWVRKNRIQDLSLGDHSSDEDDLLYNVQNGAANLLLYVGLGTMCVGMIIAFVGTGEKGFKTMELRLIGPSLIGVGILIIILRVLLCFCPCKCLQLRKKKHKLKNSSNKLNSEGNAGDEDGVSPTGSKTVVTEETPDQVKIPGKNVQTNSGVSGKIIENTKKRVSIAMPPITPGFSTNMPTSSSSYSSRNLKSSKSQGGGPLHRPPPPFPLPLLPTTTYQGNVMPMLAVSFMEREKPSSSKSWPHNTSAKAVVEDLEAISIREPETSLEVTELNGHDFDAISSSSIGSHKHIDQLPDTLPTPDGEVSTDASASVTSNLNEISGTTTKSDKATATTTTNVTILNAAASATTSGSSKFEMARNPKNLATTELLLCPSALSEAKDSP